MSETPRKKQEVVEIPGEDGGTITFDYNGGKSEQVEHLDNLARRSNALHDSSYVQPPVTNGEKVLVGLILSAVAGFVGLAAWGGWKSEQKLEAERQERAAEMKRKRAEREEWFDTQRKEGKVVIETRDGEYLAIPAEAYAQAEVRKKAL